MAESRIIPTIVITVGLLMLFLSGGCDLAVLSAVLPGDFQRFIAHPSWAELSTMLSKMMFFTFLSWPVIGLGVAAVLSNLKPRGKTPPPQDPSTPS